MILLMLTRHQTVQGLVHNYGGLLGDSRARLIARSWTDGKYRDALDAWGHSKLACSLASTITYHGERLAAVFNES